MGQAQPRANYVRNIADPPVLYRPGNQADVGSIKLGAKRFGSACNVEGHYLRIGVDVRSGLIEPAKDMHPIVAK